jgi:TatD DNase family protein
MVRPRWVDFHCHLDLYPDHTALIEESDREEIATLAVTTTPKAWRRNVELAQRSPYVRVALGLHPQLVSERAEEVVVFEQLLAGSRYVGEVGLDAGPRYYASFAAQERVFSRILDACAEQGNKVLTIHSVRTAAKVLGHLERRLLPERGKAVLHWFTGTAAEAKRAVDLGCYFSINSEMLRTEKHRRLVRLLPADRLLTETDGPFVAFGARPARPSDVKHAVNLLAETLAMSRDLVESLVVKNLGDLTRSRGG